MKIQQLQKYVKNEDRTYYERYLKHQIYTKSSSNILKLV